MMKAFRVAFWEAFTEGESALRVALGERLYMEEAPNGARLPFAVFSVPMEAEDITFSSRLPELTLQLDLYAKTRNEADTLADHARAFVEGTQFQVDGHSVVEAAYLQTSRIQGTYARHTVVEFRILLHRAA